jgi:segregation and condensation protein A
MPYEVQLPLFEGPLDLLLRLIEREELEITAVSVAQIADQFLSYLSILHERPAAELADFLVMAARLLVIKSRALLPRPPQPVDPMGEEDPAEVLARQLREYKRYRQAAMWLSERETAGARAYVRAASPPDIVSRLAPGEVTFQDLLVALRQALAESEPPSPAPITTPATVTIAQRIARIVKATADGRHVGFRKLLGRVCTRIDIIVTLLALLELIKQHRVTVMQTRLFGDIVISALETVTEPAAQGAA